MYNQTCEKWIFGRFCCPRERDGFVRLKSLPDSLNCALTWKSLFKTQWTVKEKDLNGFKKTEMS